MKKHTSKEAYYERIKILAEVNKPSIKESKIRNLGSLIDYKRAADGVAYGIVKENHNYYLKKGGIKNDPDVADFVYIGGLENITGFQFKTLAEADKQRNMVFHNINEAITLIPNKTSSKMILKEDDAKDNIDQAEEKLGDLEAATDAEDIENSGEQEMAAGLENEPIGGETPPEGGEEEISVDSEEELSPENGELSLDGGEIPPEGGEEEISVDSEEELSADGEEEMSVDGENESENYREVQKILGDLIGQIDKTDMSDSNVKYVLNSLVAVFSKELRKMDITDRKEIAKGIMDVVEPDEIEDLGQNVEDTTEVNEEECSECGGFGKYAESRGYDSPEAFMECDDEEKSNIISGYANAHNDGMNDGDLKTVSIVITPEIIEKLKGDYGHDEYAEKLTPYTDSMNETSDEDKMAELNELWSGLGRMVKKAGQGVGNVVQKGAQAVGQAAQNVKQTYYAGEKNAAIKRLEGLAQQLNGEIKKVQTTGEKAGQEPVNVQSLLQTITSGIQSKGAANLGKFRTAENVDPSNVQVQPNVLKEDDDEEIENAEEKEIGFAPDAQSLGVTSVKPESTTTGVDINIDPDKNVSISMNESERKLRKYIRNRLEEKTGLKKPSINESKKSTALKKLDAAIDKQFNLYESVSKKN